MALAWLLPARMLGVQEPDTLACSSSLLHSACTDEGGFILVLYFNSTPKGNLIPSKAERYSTWQYASTATPAPSACPLRWRGNDVRKKLQYTFSLITVLHVHGVQPLQSPGAVRP